MHQYEYHLWVPGSSGEGLSGTAAGMVPTAGFCEEERSTYARGTYAAQDRGYAALETMCRIYASLEIPADERELSRVVEKHAWENIPDRKKGSGKFYRKGSPGGWANDLTVEQVRIVESITAPILDRYYAEDRQPRSTG